MKIYWDVGFKQLPSASGFKGATLTSLQCCFNFTNTSRFIFLVWEVLLVYQHMYSLYITQNADISHCNTYDNFKVYVAAKAKIDDNWSVSSVNRGSQIIWEQPFSP